MNLSNEKFRAAAQESGLSEDQASLLWTNLSRSAAAENSARFDVTHVAYYLGAMIVIGAMGWLMNSAWESFGGGGLLVIAVGYAVIFYIGARNLWPNPVTRTPSGLLLTMAVCMTPLGVYGLSRWTGFWPEGDPGAYRNFHPYINASWVFMEIATVISGLVALRFYRFPFLTAPIAFALWFLSMDASAWLNGHDWQSWSERALVSALFGVGMLLVAYFTDLLNRAEDFAFWLYLFGVLAFWGGLTSIDSGSELGKFFYCLINLGLIAISLVLRRRVFAIFGSFGFFGYLGHLAYRVFEDSIIFPFALTALGLAVIAAGIGYSRFRPMLEQHWGAPLRRLCGNLLPPRVR